MEGVVVATPQTDRQYALPLGDGTRACLVTRFVRGEAPTIDWRYVFRSGLTPDSQSGR